MDGHLGGGGHVPGGGGDDGGTSPPHSPLEEWDLLADLHSAGETPPTGLRTAFGGAAAGGSTPLGPLAEPLALPTGAPAELQAGGAAGGQPQLPQQAMGLVAPGGGGSGGAGGGPPAPLYSGIPGHWFQQVAMQQVAMHQAMHQHQQAMQQQLVMQQPLAMQQQLAMQRQHQPMHQHQEAGQPMTLDAAAAELASRAAAGADDGGGGAADLALARVAAALLEKSLGSERLEPRPNTRERIDALIADRRGGAAFGPRVQTRSSAQDGQSVSHNLGGRTSGTLTLVGTRDVAVGGQQRTLQLWALVASGSWKAAGGGDRRQGGCRRYVAVLSEHGDLDLRIKELRAAGRGAQQQEEEGEGGEAKPGEGAGPRGFQPWKPFCGAWLSDAAFYCYTSSSAKRWAAFTFSRGVHIRRCILWF